MTIQNELKHHLNNNKKENQLTQISLINLVAPRWLFLCSTIVYMLRKYYVNDDGYIIPSNKKQSISRILKRNGFPFLKLHCIVHSIAAINAFLFCSFVSNFFDVKEIIKIFILEVMFKSMVYKWGDAIKICILWLNLNLKCRLFYYLSVIFLKI